MKRIEHISPTSGEPVSIRF